MNFYLLNNRDVIPVYPQFPPGVANIPVDMVLHFKNSGVRCPVSESYQNEYGSPFLGTSKTTLYIGCPPNVEVALNRLVFSSGHDIQGWQKHEILKEPGKTRFFFK